MNSDNESLTKLIEEAHGVAMTAEQREEQRISFAFGNLAMHNPDITREAARAAAAEVAASLLGVDSP